MIFLEFFFKTLTKSPTMITLTMMTKTEEGEEGPEGVEEEGEEEKRQKEGDVVVMTERAVLLPAAASGNGDSISILTLTLTPTPTLILIPSLIGVSALVSMGLEREKGERKREGVGGGYP